MLSTVDKLDWPHGVGTWDPCELTMSCNCLRGTSHYGQRSRGRRFPPIILQETKSSASRPFTLRLKSKGHRNLKCILFDEGDGPLKEVWVGREWKPKLWSRGCQFFSLKIIIGKTLVVRLEGLFWTRNKVGCSFGFGLWAWPLEASHYAWSKAPLTIFYWLFSSPFLCTLNKVWPLNPTASRRGRS
jgi:hypothetical protein